MRTLPKFTANDVIERFPCWAPDKVRAAFLLNGHASIDLLDAARSNLVSAAEFCWLALQEGFAPTETVISLAASELDETRPVLEQALSPQVVDHLTDAWIGNAAAAIETAAATGEHPLQAREQIADAMEQELDAMIPPGERVLRGIERVQVPPGEKADLRDAEDVFLNKDVFGLISDCREVRGAPGGVTFNPKCALDLMGDILDELQRWVAL